MATGNLTPMMRRLRQTLLPADGAGVSDGQLLEWFIQENNEAAFEVLVRRHGAMVLGVCRRLLRRPQDVEDAFQATFLVLVRKAGTIVPRGMVANWLYGVAYQTALKARALAARRGTRERQVYTMPEPTAATPAELWADLRPLLDQELSRLPDKYRVPIVLCDLESKTRKQAAQHLGWPEGTVASRLMRGRQMLARRLGRRGLLASGGVLAGLFAQNAASASVPAALVTSTVNAATLLAAGHSAAAASVSVAALTQGVLKAMLLNKLKTALVVCLTLGACTMGGVGVAGRVGLVRTAQGAVVAELPQQGDDDLDKQKKEIAERVKQQLLTQRLMNEIDEHKLAIEAREAALLLKKREMQDKYELIQKLNKDLSDSKSVTFTEKESPMDRDSNVVKLKKRLAELKQMLAEKDAALDHANVSLKKLNAELASLKRRLGERNEKRDQ